MDPLVRAYEVTVRGNYYAASGKDRLLKVFGPVTFTIPETVKIPNGKKRVPKKEGGKTISVVEQQYADRSVTVPNVALYVVQRQLLPPWLAANHPDSVSFRICAIVPGGLRPVMKPASEVNILIKPVMEMSVAELVIFCKMHQIPVEPSAFGSTNDAREAVQYELEMKGAAAPSSAAPTAPPTRPETARWASEDSSDKASGPGDGANPDDPANETDELFK